MGSSFVAGRPAPAEPDKSPRRNLEPVRRLSRRSLSARGRTFTDSPGNKTPGRLRRGSFTSLDELMDAIELWAEHWNDDSKPFIWHKTAEEIITKVIRERAALTQVKPATGH